MKEMDSLNVDNDALLLKQCAIILLAVPCACSHDNPHEVSTALIFMMPALVLAEPEPEPTTSKSRYTK